MEERTEKQRRDARWMLIGGGLGLLVVGVLVLIAGSWIALVPLFGAAISLGVSLRENRNG